MDAEKIHQIVTLGGPGWEMWELLNTYHQYRAWLMVHRKTVALGDKDKAAQTAQWLAEAQEVSNLDALRVSTRLADHLLGCRWYMMRDARDNGADWADIAIPIGLALKHDAPPVIAVAAAKARDWYLEQIEQQERVLGDLHDAAGARAMLGETSLDSHSCQQD